MKPKDKELLLKDLCARQPYNTQIQGTIYEDILDNDGEETGKVEEKTVTFNLYIIGKNSIMYNGYWISLDLCKPYLRPMSSMTEEEKKELKELHFYYTDSHIVNDEDEDFKPIIVDEVHCSCIIDWLNSHHFDYRGLIKKGLALEAPEGMYDIQ